MRCNNETLMKLISEKHLSKNTQVHFSLLRDLPDCRKIATKNFHQISGAYTRRTTRPVNRFQCMPKGCVNTGTIVMAAANETVSYRIPGDAREIAAGAVTFYVKPDSVPTTVTVKLSDKDTFANANVYEVEITEITADGYAPVTIDLSTVPASEEGNGWEPSAVGYIQLSADKVVSYSSIAFFESILDFATNDVVTVGCLSSMGGTFDISAIEARCQAAGYDDNVTSLTFPVTGNQVSSNWMLLNPLLSSGTSSSGFTVSIQEKVVESYTVDDKTYGRIQIVDAAEDECGFYAAQPAEDCNSNYLSRISVPELVDLDEEHFQVITNEDGTVDIVFNENYIGQNIRILYPQTAEDIEEYVANVENLNSVRVRMYVETETTEGVKYIHIFDNVLITSFPFTISESEVEFAFTITILKDDEGNFYRVQKIAA